MENNCGIEIEKLDLIINNVVTNAIGIALGVTGAAYQLERIDMINVNKSIEDWMEMSCRWFTTNNSDGNCPLFDRLKRANR